jgi:hypothetical protein
MINTTKTRTRPLFAEDEEFLLQLEKERKRANSDVRPMRTDGVDKRVYAREFN